MHIKKSVAPIVQLVLPWIYVATDLINDHRDHFAAIEKQRLMATS
jgi:hypothetical protein